MPELIAGQLRRRVRRAGADPFLTYYDLATGERVELSAVTFANWIDKTSNLLSDELLVDELAGGEPVRIELDVAATHPGHWVSLVWELACWQVGAEVTLGLAAEADLVVCGPEVTSAGRTDALVACSLHPLGLGFATPVPSGVIDYALEVRAQPDSHVPVPLAPEMPAWRDGLRRLSQADLVTGPVPEPTRRLVRPSEPWTTCAAALIDPLRSGGSTVVVIGGDADAWEHIREQERAAE